MLHRFTLTAAAALLAAGPALAGGFAIPVVVAAPAAPVVVPATPVVVSSRDWSGGYVGGQLGFGRSMVEDTGGESEDLEDRGALFGLHAGYMFDFGRVVAGGEIDFDRTQISIGEDAGLADERIDIDSIARAKLRVGFDAGRILPYVTAGIAQARLSSEDQILSADLEDTYDGRFVGLGASFAVSDQFMVGIEGLRHEFEEAPFQSFDAQVSTLTLRGSFRF